MNSRERELRHLIAPLVRTYEPILANDNSTEAEINTAAAAVARANLYKAEARALGITLPSTVAELNAPVGEPTVRSGAGAEYADAPHDGRVVRSDQRVSDLPSVPKTGIDMTRAFRGMVLDDWRGVEQRAIQNEGTGSAGQFLVNPELSANVIDLVRAQSVCVESGTQTINEEGAQVPSLYLAKVLTDPTSQWIGEGVAQTPSSMTYARIQLIPRVLTTMVEASIELLQDSPTAMDTMINSITKSFAVELDRIGLAGSGAGAQPQGIKGTSGVGVNTPGANGDTLVAASAYQSILKGIGAVRAANVEPDTLILNPRTQTSLDSMVTTLYDPLQAPSAVSGLRHRLSTNSISATQAQGTASTSTDAYVGRFSDSAFGIWQNLLIEVSREGATVGGSSWLNRTCMVRAILRADFAVLRPASFYVVSGLLN